MTSLLYKKWKYVRIIVFIIGLVLFYLSFKLNIDFITRYSPDKYLHKATISKIIKFQYFLRITSILLVILSFVMKLRFIKFKILRFLRRNKKIIQNILLLVCVIIVFLIVGEIILRVITPIQTNEMGCGPAYLKFLDRYTKLNSQGFRDYEYDYNKEQDVYRAFVLGDSFTFGLGIKDVNNTFPKLLERKLNLQSTNKFEIINAARPGADTVYEFELLKTKGIKYEPDLVILGYTLNDMEDAEKMGSANTKELIPVVGFWLKNTSYLYFFLENRIQNLINKLKKTDNDYEKFILDSYSKDSQIYKEHLNTLTNLIDYCNKNNIKLIVVLYPLLYKFEDYPYLDITKNLKEFFENKEVIVIDIYPYLKEKKAESYWVFPIDSHPNEIVHNRTSNLIFERLINNNLIKL